MLALYRKYRPQRFEDIAGQPHITQTLQNEIKLGRFPHAFLFTGPRGTGKTSTARILAAALNCPKQKEGEPCGDCDHCGQIRSGSFIDLIEIDAASQTGVDNVRENIIEHARFVPQRGGYKVFIIDEAHMLSNAAWNALLKTLEEPPSHTVFILATTEVKKIPDTIVSRCQYFRFKPLDHETLKNRLEFIVKQEKVSLDEKTVNEIALRSGGFVRDAESLLGICLSTGAKKIKWEDVRHLFDQSPLRELQTLARALIGGNMHEAVTITEQLQSDGITSETILTDLLSLYRTLLYFLMTRELHPLFLKKHGAEGEKLIKSLMDSSSPSFDLAHRSFQVLITNLDRMKSVPADIALEMVIADICQIAAFPSQTSSAPLPPAAPLTHEPDVNKAVDSAPAPSPRKHSKPSPLASVAEKPAKKKKADVAAADKAKPAPSEKIEKIKDTLALTLPQVQEIWKALLDTIRGRSGSLPLVLNFAKLLSVEADNRLRIGFTYPLHYTQVKQDKNRQILELALTEHLHTPVAVDAVMLAHDDQAKDDKPNESLLHNVIDFFGGKIVES